MSDVLLEQPKKPREKDTLYLKVFIPDCIFFWKSHVRLFIIGLCYPALRVLGTVGYSGH